MEQNRQPRHKLHVIEQMVSKTPRLLCEKRTVSSTNDLEKLNIQKDKVGSLSPLVYKN
jgi:hypothetical protein